MRVVICNSQSQPVAWLEVGPGRVEVVRGTFPGGLSSSDLENLGFVYYETDERGEVVTRVREVSPGESLEYLRALMDALPPGYHIARVDSEIIENQLRARRRRWEEELARLDEEESS
ncbi:MAG TPA: hypothetical protein VNO81_14165 [Candidatus Nitrosotenuis sp.]|jgi:hypothetical protein|nr:hypothetical protein [Candidatus Nitrosotenuis sp.]